jgi:hypothetical protein
MTLKVVTNEKQGVGKAAIDRYRLRTVVIAVLFSFYLAAIMAAFQSLGRSRQSLEIFSCSSKICNFT